MNKNNGRMMRVLSTKHTIYDKLPFPPDSSSS